jgi:hypothetical protein
MILIQDKPTKKTEGDRKWKRFAVNMNRCTPERVELLMQKPPMVFVHPLLLKYATGKSLQHLYGLCYFLCCSCVSVTVFALR